MSDAINPKHYKNHLVIPASRVDEFINPETGDLELQWMDKMEFTLTPEEFKGLLKGQADKYLSRLGQKDAPEQEVRKSGWYIERLANFFRKG